MKTLEVPDMVDGGEYFLGAPHSQENLLNLLDCSVVAVWPSTDFLNQVYELSCMLTVLTG